MARSLMVAVPIDLGIEQGCTYPPLVHTRFAYTPGRSEMAVVVDVVVAGWLRHGCLFIP